MNNKKEALYAAVDVGTTKVQTLVARVDPSGNLDVLASGLVASMGMKKGMVVGISDLQNAVRESVEQATRELGQALPPANVGVTGRHISSFNSSTTMARHGNHHHPISPKEVEQAAHSVRPRVLATQQVLHVIPRGYAVDGLGGVRNPVGLSAARMDVESHVVVAEVPAMENVARVVRRAGVEVKGLVLEPLASSEAVLTADEREMGVVMIDVGGGTSDIAVFQDGTIWHTAVIDVGGFHFTNDIAQALRIPVALAEEAKLKYGSAEAPSSQARDYVELAVAGSDLPRKLDRNRLRDVLHARARDLVQLVVAKLKQGGLARIPAAGIVLTGGSAKMPGLVELTAETVSAPVRLGTPKASFNLPPKLTDPASATSVGLLLWSFRERVAGINGNGHGNWDVPGYRKLALWLGRAFLGRNYF